MEYSDNDFISTEEILADALLFSNEQEFRNLTRGFFTAQIRQCLEELSYDTFFREAHLSFDIPANRIIEIPAGVFNIKEMSLFNGTACSPGNSVNVYFKRNFFHLGSQNFFARNQTHNGNDPFHGSASIAGGAKGNTPANVFQNNSDLQDRPTNLYYFGYSNGNIMLSASCSQFSKVMVRFNGIWAQKDKPIVPRFFRQVVIDWCVERALRAKKASNPQLRNDWMDARTTLGYGTTNNFSGSWYKAEVRVKRMGTKKKQDMGEYLMRPNI